jgi:hypothetical protein
MRRAALMALVVTAGVMIGLTRRGPRGDTVQPSPRPRPTPAAEEVASLPELLPPPERNVFAFAGRGGRSGPGQPVAAVGEAQRPPAWSAAAEDGSAASVAALPRLVGFLLQGERLMAVLAWQSEVLVLGAGDAQAGLLLESVDEEFGVSLRLDDGRQLELLPE